MFYIIFMSIKNHEQSSQGHIENKLKVDSKKFKEFVKILEIFYIFP